MSKVRVFVIEDDFIQFSKVEMMLDEMGYDLIGHAESGGEALNMIAAMDPDILLVDIQIKGERSGIEVVEQLKEPVPVIFTTSFKDKATIDRAKETRPYAYLIKPYEKESLQAAIELAIFRFKKTPDVLTASDDDGWQEEDQAIKGAFFLKISGMLTKVRTKEIMYIEVKDKNCLIGIDGEVYSVRMPLYKMEMKLPETSFVRVHRSFMVNLNHIEKVDLVKNQVHLGSYEVPIGRAYRDDLLDQLENLND